MLEEETYVVNNEKRVVKNMIRPFQKRSKMPYIMKRVCFLICFSLFLITFKIIIIKKLKNDIKQSKICSDILLEEKELTLPISFFFTQWWRASESP